MAHASNEVPGAGGPGRPNQDLPGTPGRPPHAAQLPTEPDRGGGPLWPRIVYHKDSTPGNLIWREAVDAEALKALGSDYGDLASLGFETAPAAGTPPYEPEPEKAHKRTKGE